MPRPLCMSDDGQQAVFVGTMLENGAAVALCDDCLVSWAAAVLAAMTGVDPTPFLQAISDPPADTTPPPPSPDPPAEPAADPPLGQTRGGVTVGRSQPKSGARRTATATADTGPPTTETGNGPAGQ